MRETPCPWFPVAQIINESGPVYPGPLPPTASSAEIESSLGKHRSRELLRISLVASLRDGLFQRIHPRLPDVWNFVQVCLQGFDRRAPGKQMRRSFSIGGHVRSE